MQQEQLHGARERLPCVVILVGLLWELGIVSCQHLPQICWVFEHGGAQKKLGRSAFYNQVDQDWWIVTTECTCAEDTGRLDLCKQVEIQYVVHSYFSFTGCSHEFIIHAWWWTCSSQFDYGHAEKTNIGSSVWGIVRCLNVKINSVTHPEEVVCVI